MTGDSPSLFHGESSYARHLWQSVVVKQLGLSTISIPMSSVDEVRAKSCLTEMGKNSLIKLFIEAWKHVSDAQSHVKSLIHSEREISGKLIASQKETIRLQKELLSRKDEELQKVRSVVEDSVKDTVEGLKSVVETAVDISVMKSYSQVASTTATAPAAPILDSRVLRRAIQDASEADERASNVVLFGLSESVEENLREEVGQVLDSVGEKPPFEAERIGNQREGATRPVLVKFRSGAVAAGILRRSGSLKKTDDFKSVYISPDRTLLQRKEHRLCVAELRKRCGEDSSRFHVIRDGDVISMDRGKGVGDGEKG